MMIYDDVLSITLRNEVEMFIRGGKLTKFLDKEEGGRNRLRENHPREIKPWDKLTTLKILEGLRFDR
jgi:hypothetical protein